MFHKSSETNCHFLEISKQFKTVIQLSDNNPYFAVIDWVSAIFLQEQKQDNFIFINGWKWGQTITNGSH